jgi:hypothetical protein
MRITSGHGGSLILQQMNRHNPRTKMRERELSALEEPKGGDVFDFIIEADIRNGKLNVEKDENGNYVIKNEPPPPEDEEEKGFGYSFDVRA